MRVGFANDEIRENFLETCKRKLGVSSWSGLASYLKIHRNLLYRYRDGDLLLSEEHYNSLVRLLNHKFTIMNSYIYFKDDHWGKAKGGRNAYNKNKEFFKIGRKKGLKKLLSMSERCFTFNLNQNLSIELCEFIGAFIGDGFTGNYQNHYTTQFTGDRRYDYGYYEQVIIPISKQLFNNINCYISEKDNTLRVKYYSKALFLFLTEQFNLPPGLKVYTVKIPYIIIEHGKDYVFPTLRGIFDTDGCIFYDKRPIYKKPYPRIEIKLINETLILQIRDLLTQYGFSPAINGKKTVVYLYGKQVDFFFEQIGSSNSRHLKRFEEGLTNPRNLGS